MASRGTSRCSTTSVAADRPRSGLPGPPFALLFVQPEPGGPAVVQVEGDLDVLTAPRLAGVLAGCDSREVLVDVRAVPVLCAAGLGVLAAAADHLVAAGGRLRVAGAGKLATRCFQITGLQDLLAESAPATQPRL